MLRTSYHCHVTGLTGGLAAPLVASASIALLGPGIAFIGTHAGIVAMASVFGVAGAGLTGKTCLQ